MSTTPARALVAFALASVAVPAGASALAQNAPPPSMARASRTDLAARATTLESEASGAGVKADRKAAIGREVAEIRARLSAGDFSVGDRFAITITMDTVRSDTLSVREGLLVGVSNLPDMSLKGVLRSELDDALQAHVSRYLKNTRLRAIILTQVSITGAVARPGFYWAAPDRPLSDIIMIAGGPALGANLEEIEIRRANKVVMKGKESRKALVDGSTMEQVNMRSGDEVRVPMKRKLNWQSIIQMLFVASSLFFAFIQFVQWYYNNQQ